MCVHAHVSVSHGTWKVHKVTGSAAMQLLPDINLLRSEDALEEHSA